MKKQYKINQAAFHITYVCTHHCPMCYANAGNTLKHPSINKIYNVVNMLIKWGIYDISLVGGDPAIYPHIIELISYMHENKIKVSVLSNTLDFCGKKDLIVDKVDVVEGTIHHSLADQHDAFCQTDGAYDNLVNNLKYFSDHNKNIGIVMNLIPYNFDVFYQAIENIINKSINVNHIVVQRIIQFGRAKNTSQYEITPEIIYETMEQIERIEKDFKIKIVFEDPLPLCSIDDKYIKYMHPCEWGISKIAVDYNGNLSRCGADIFTHIGSIFNPDINKLWNNNQSLEDFRNKKYLPDTCLKCNKLKYCGGGCPISRNPEIGFSCDYLKRNN